MSGANGLIEYSLFGANILEDSYEEANAEGRDPWTYLRLTFVDAQHKTVQVSFNLPVPEVYAPEWSQIEAITGVSAAEVAKSWDAADAGQHFRDKLLFSLNSLAGAKFQLSDGCIVMLKPKFVDEDEGFTFEPFSCVQLEDSDMILALYTLPGVAKRAASSLLAPDGAEVDLSSMSATDANVDGQTPVCRFRWKTPLDVVEPAEWWTLDAVLGTHFADLAAAWKGRENPALARAAEALGRLLAGAEIPVRNGYADMERLRLLLVKRLRATGQNPVVWTAGNPPDVILDRTRALFRARLYGEIYRTQVTPGVSHGILGLARQIEGITGVELFDTIPKIRVALQKMLRFVGKSGNTVEPPKSVCENILAFADTKVPSMRYVARLPYVTPRETIHSQPGYDFASKIMYSPNVPFGEIPATPTVAEFRSAVYDLWAGFEEFPFDSPSSTAMMFAMLFEPFLKPLITGPCPMYAIDAPPFGQASGKSLVAQTVGAIFTGNSECLATWPQKEDELPQRIADHLISGDPFVAFDNIRGRVDNRDLAQLLTSTHWPHRLKFHDGVIKLTNSATWCMSLNGATFDRDLARRTVMIRLDAKVLNAHERKSFKRPQPYWALANRARLVRCAMTVIAYWLSIGKPKVAVTFASYESWSRWVLPVVAQMGFSQREIQLGVDAAKEKDTETQEFLEFIEKWSDQYTSTPAKAGLLVDVCVKHGLFRDLTRGDRGQAARNLSRMLKALNGRVVGTYVLKHLTTGFQLLPATAHDLETETTN